MQKSELTESKQAGGKWKMLYEEKIIETIPVGPLGLIPLKGCEELVGKVDRGCLQLQPDIFSVRHGKPYVPG